MLSFFALSAGLAAGPLRAGADEESRDRPLARPSLAATRPPAGLAAPAAPGPATPDVPAPAVVAPPAPAATAPAPGPAPVPALVPPERRYLQPVLEQAAAENGLPRDLVLAMAWAESSWRVDAVSTVGALGLLQLTPPTVDFVSKNLLHLDHDLDVHDPGANARMSAVYLKHLLEQTGGDLPRALMAYNQGLRSLYRDGPHPDAVAYAANVTALRPVFGGTA
ncbi:MAG TPA: transglycosylase SLT domain-containing protein [Acidimicrobiia bacterium]|nr:transglycosylase SLT domain-containing protein [Acidimicrobiia bacterium]